MQALTNNSPAVQQIITLEDGFNLLNKEFFDNMLPHVIINQQHKKSNGYFSANRWKVKDDAGTHVHEINLDPSYMKDDSKTVLATLLAIMVDLWQYCFGIPSQPGYHNKQWAEKMIAVGLRPVSNKHPGKMTGQNVGHVIIKGGVFDSIIGESSFQIRYYSEAQKPQNVKKEKVKYTCSCLTNVWGKAGLSIICRNCNRPFIERLQQEEKEPGFIEKFIIATDSQIKKEKICESVAY
jgi:hypothetical protein